MTRRGPTPRRVRDGAKRETARTTEHMKTKKCLDCPTKAKRGGVLCQGCWDATVKPGESARVTEPQSQPQRRSSNWGSRILPDKGGLAAAARAAEEERYALDHIDHGESGREDPKPATVSPTGREIPLDSDRGMPKDRYRSLSDLERTYRNLAEPGPYWRYLEQGRLGAFQPVTRRFRNASSSPEERTEQFRRLLKKELEKSASAASLEGAVLTFRLDTTGYPAGGKTRVDKPKQEPQREPCVAKPKR